MIEVVGELISKPYIEITLNLLARFGIDVRREGWQRFTIPAGSRYRSPGSIHVEADASSASYFVALGAIAAQARAGAHRRRGRRLDPGRHPLRRCRAADGRQVDRRPELARGVARRLAAQGHRPGLQPHPGRGHDAGRDGAVRRRPQHAAQHRQLARQGNGSPRRHGHRTAQARRRRWRKARTSSASPPPAAGLASAASIHTYDDHRIAMCFSLAAFNPAGVPVRILDPQVRRQDLPRLLRDAVLGRADRRAAHPGDLHRWPDRLGQGHAGLEVARRLGYHYLDSGALYRITGARGASAPGSTLDTAHEHSIAKLAETLPVRFLRRQGPARRARRDATRSAPKRPA